MKLLGKVGVGFAAVYAGVIVADAITVWHQTARHRAHVAARVCLSDENLEAALADWALDSCVCTCGVGCAESECDCECTCAPPGPEDARDE